MIPGLSGSILSHDAMIEGGYAEPVDGRAQSVRQELVRWHAQASRSAGPAWSARQVFDEIVVTVCKTFGFQIVPTNVAPERVDGQLLAHGLPVAVVAATGWGQDPGIAWRESIRTGIGADVRWCFCFNGPTLRVFDASRAHSRRYAELDLMRVVTEAPTFALAWRLLRADGFVDPDGSVLDRAATASERHRVDVRESLQAGVHIALTHLTNAFARAHRGRRHSPSAREAFDESLVVIYRVLFLLFAEARGLVPTWHPVFRESYTIEALRPSIEARAATRGTWQALQAIARLAHKGCRAGALRVPAFNGRLFSPAHAPLADALPLDERLVRDALAALTMRPARGGLQRIAYADLGVEHLGGVYERVLDFDVTTAGRRVQLVRGTTRKSTGSFYTPRSLTEHLVRRTLAPLVADRDPDAILRLRIVDPAMGSGAFLVAACRYLAQAYETALVREGVVALSDITEGERAAFRRIVAQKCLYGVDMNPMAVQLARLSLWLATLSGDRPLTFFDHHLRAGNSLVGATIEDVLRGAVKRRRRDVALPLFDLDGLDRDVSAAVARHMALRDGQEETLEQVRAKEKAFVDITSPNGPLARWKRVADLWCASWFDPSVARLKGTVLRDLLSDAGALPPAFAASLLDAPAAAARRERFFHWTLEFPDVFMAPEGSRAREGGFDAVIGNPPWDVLRGADSGRMTRFSRESGNYQRQGTGHPNLYQLFAERSLTLLRRGGRLGLVLPSGFATDFGSAALRRYLLDETTVDGMTFVDNRSALFPIHRGLKFALLTTTAGGRTMSFPCRFGVHATADFDRLPEMGRDPGAVIVNREMLERLSSDQLAIPELQTETDAALAVRLTAAHPRASDVEGWGLRFGRELNATDDKEHFVAQSPRGLPVVEGKQIQPFQVDLEASRYFIDRAVAQRLLPARPFSKTRLAYRDVAASTNRLTLIAAVLPPGTVTTHTLFCLKTPLDEDAQLVLCGLFNSYVANYLVRLRVSTHVTVAIVESLPLPVVDREGGEFTEMVGLVRQLGSTRFDHRTAASHQALAARLYGLTAGEFEHVLTTFPLIDRAERDQALRVFVDRL